MFLLNNSLENCKYNNNMNIMQAAAVLYNSNYHKTMALKHQNHTVAVVVDIGSVASFRVEVAHERGDVLRYWHYLRRHNVAHVQKPARQDRDCDVARWLTVKHEVCQVEVARLKWLSH